MRELRHRPATNARRDANATVSGLDARVAQLVEHMTENHGVGGSIPSPGTTPDLAECCTGLYKPAKLAVFLAL